MKSGRGYVREYGASDVEVLTVYHVEAKAGNSHKKSGVRRGKLQKQEPTTDWNEYAGYYITQLGGPDSDNAYHRLIEADDAIIPILIGALRTEQNPDIRSELVRILWQRRFPEATDFLSDAVGDSAGEVTSSTGIRDTQSTHDTV